MKRASDLHSIMAMEIFVVKLVCMNGSRCMVNERSITSVEHMSLKEQTQAAHSIRDVSGLVLLTMSITLLMICLVELLPLQNNNTMTKIEGLEDPSSGINRGTRPNSN